MNRPLLLTTIGVGAVVLAIGLSYVLLEGTKFAPPREQATVQDPGRMAPPLVAEPEIEISTEEALLSKIDAILQRLEFANLAFNAPERMLLDKVREVQALLSFTISLTELGAMIEEEGRIEAHRIKVTEQMEAKLEGVGFEVTPEGPQPETITRAEPTEWNWQIKATAEGRQPLYLTLTAIVNIDGRDRKRKIKTFKKEILVEVSRRQAVVKFFKDWGVVLGAIGALFTIIGGMYAAYKWWWRRSDRP